MAARARKVAQRARTVLQLDSATGWPRSAWNGYRHLELYFGVSGSGRVLHTLNPRLHPEQIAWIANHAEDQVLCFDLTLLAHRQGDRRPLRHHQALCGICVTPTSCPRTAAFPGC